MVHAGCRTALRSKTSSVFCLLLVQEPGDVKSKASGLRICLSYSLGPMAFLSTLTQDSFALVPKMGAW